MRRILLCCVIPAIILITGCKGKNLLDVESTNFTNQIDQLQNLEFSFSHDVAHDSIIDVWDSINYITFKPEVEGKFRWENKRKLVFSPKGPFAPSTDYVATLTSKITDLSIKLKSFKESQFRFHTPYLTVDNNYAYWARSESNQDIELRVMLIFNYPVVPSDISKFGSVVVDDKPGQLRLITSENSTQIEVAIPYIAGIEKIKSLQIKFKPGLTAIGSESPLKNEFTTDVTIPSSDKLEITEITTGFEEGQGILSVYTSQPVIAQGLNSVISVEPSVDYEVTLLSNGFQLKGSFNENQTYKVTISKSLTGIFGPKLIEEYIHEATFGSPEPFLGFADESGMYLSSEGAGNIGLRIIGIPKIKITVFRLFENNIQHYLRNGKQWEWYNNENEYYDNYAYPMSQDYGQVLKTVEYSTGSLPKKGSLRLLHITPQDLDLSSEMKGIYLIRAESPDKAWLSDVQLLSFSDIGLIVRKSDDEIFVAARSIATAEPLGAVTLNFYSSNNQMVHKITTSGDGTAYFKNIKTTIPGFHITMITARRGEDYNVIILNRSEVELSRFDVGGKYTAGMQYDALLYGDRDLYRPGDSIYSNIIIRDFRFNTVGGFPVKLRVLSPDGKDYLKKRIDISKEGSGEMSFMIPEGALTGTYTLEVLTVNDVLIGSRRVKVEEFMPDRITVKVSSDKKDYSPGETLTLTVQADNLFGTPAANRKVENELRVNRIGFVPKSYNDYNFSLTSKEELNIMSTISEGVTSPTGIYTKEFQLPAFINSGLLSGQLFTTVFDETGRPVNRLLQFNLYTQRTFLGLRRLPGWVTSGKPVNINIIALNEKEQPVASRARLEVVSVRWETVIEKNYGQTRYRSQRRETIVLSRTIDVSRDGFTMPYTPNSSGEYLVRLRLPESNFWTEESFYAYRWGESDESSFSVSKEGNVDISFDKKKYNPGEEAKILFKTPFAGELLVTVEQNNVLEHYSVKADNNGASLSLKIKDDFIPNVYITATLIRKTKEAGIPLTVAHGFMNMEVEKPDNRLPVIITAPEHIRSDVKQRITVKSEPGAEVTIAVVDQGILQITDYKTPDPYGFFYGKRALEVSAYDLFDELLPELAANYSSPGGDQGFDLGKRLNPLTAKRVKLLSLWSGRKKLNSAGIATFDAVIPKFSGAVRIMAVVYKEHKFGSAEKLMKVSDPIVISSSVPRFMSPGDQANINVTLTNTTNKAMNASVKINTTSSVRQLLMAELKGSGSMKIPANSEAVVNYTLKAANNIGTGSITVEVSGSGEKFSEKIDLSVRPAIPLVKKAETGVIQGAKKVSLDPLAEFLPGTGRSRLLLTKNPAGLYAKDIQELVNYPYGCMEQTISSAFPQLYYSNLAALLDKGDQKAAVTDNINEAIRKINAFQQYNGGLVMWPDGGTINWWITAYAAHFLYEAERAGFTVNRQVVNSLHAYLLEMIKQKPSTDHYYYLDDKGWIKKNEPSREIFYSLYVLALNGKHHLPTMNYYKTKIDLLSIDSRFMLASAYMLAGDSRSYTALVPKSWSDEESQTMTGYSFSSPIRDRAIALYTLLSVDINNPMVPILARQIGEMMRKASWLNTQERVFSMLALGKLASISAKGNISAEIIYGNKKAEFKDKDLIIDLKDNHASVNTSGTGSLYWYHESEGLPQSLTVKEEDRILKVRRKLFTRTGQPITSGSFNRNDLLVMSVAVSTTDNSIIENVVVADILPACFEIENSRITVTRGMEWINNKSVPDHMDIRDDRILFFTNVNGNVKTFYYLVRVVNSGTFTHGPASAEAMYNGQYYSYSGHSKITVR
jgi:alpha-2-macroglobulin